MMGALEQLAGANLRQDIIHRQAQPCKAGSEVQQRKAEHDGPCKIEAPGHAQESRKNADGNEGDRIQNDLARGGVAVWSTTGSMRMAPLA